MRSSVENYPYEVCYVGYVGYNRYIRYFKRPIRRSLGEACARVGVAARFKQNVWNATKRARAGGWADDGAADEFLDPPTTESVRSAEG